MTKTPNPRLDQAIAEALGAPAAQGPAPTDEADGTLYDKAFSNTAPATGDEFAATLNGKDRAVWDKLKKIPINLDEDDAANSPSSIRLSSEDEALYDKAFRNR